MPLVESSLSPILKRGEFYLTPSSVTTFQWNKCQISTLVFETQIGAYQGRKTYVRYQGRITVRYQGRNRALSGS